LVALRIFMRRQRSSLWACLPSTASSPSPHVGQAVAVRPNWVVVFPVSSSIAWNQCCLSFPWTEPSRSKISFARTEIISSVNEDVVFAGVASAASRLVAISFSVGDDRASDAIVTFFANFIDF
jgi:hypothetical protein